MLSPLTVPLTRADASSGFHCEEEALNSFFRQYARQNQDAYVSKTWVLRRPEDRPELPLVLGYYTLTLVTIERQHLPDSLVKRLPRYPIPAVRIGRLARDLRVKGMGVGEDLLQDAQLRALLVAEQAGSVVVTVDAKNPRAFSFYTSFGYLPHTRATDASDEWPRSLFIPIDTIRSSIQDA